MILKRLKKLIIPLIIAKFVILGFILFRSDAISISRDENYSSNYGQPIENDSIVLKKQKLIRIVRNEEKHHISIILRGKKTAIPQREKEEELPLPIVD
jgi:hypothetical protein